MKTNNPFPHFHRKAWEQHVKKSERKRSLLIGCMIMIMLSISTFMIAGTLSETKSTAGVSTTAVMSTLAVAPIVFKASSEKGFSDNPFAGGSGKDGKTKEEEQAEFIETIKKAVKELPGYKAFEGMKDNPDFSADFTKLKAAVDSLKPGASKEEFDALKTICEEMGLQVKALREKGNPTPDKASFKTQMNDWIKKNSDQIKKIASAKSGHIELEFKAADTMTLDSGTIVGDIPQFPIWGNPDFNLIGDFISQFITVTQTNMPMFPYTEMLPKDGDFSFLGETEVKPEMDFKWETRYVTPKKTAAWIKLSTEVAADVPRIQSLANSLLLKKHNIKKQRAIISGSGVDPEPKGMIEYGRAFNASNVNVSVTAPNIFDVINACYVDILTTHNYTDEMPYQANIVFMHPIDYFQYIQTPKDGLNRPLYNYFPVGFNAQVGSVANPQEPNTNGMTTLQIISTPEVERGSILVCDASKYNLANYIPYTVKIGWVNDDFIKNQFVILAESRFFTWVEKLDEQAFIYDSIENVMTALESGS